ncbi:MAG: hypothetical protein Q9166_000230 [cf. Caloplaca sp. 2 TL-2023]
MRLIVAISVFLLLPFAIAGSYWAADVDDDALEKRYTPTTTSALGYLPNGGQIGTGTPSLNGNVHPGHGPAVVPQPGENNTSDMGHEDGGDSSNKKKTLVVRERRYKHNGHRRVQFKIKYGESHVQQTWEVRNGVLNLIPEESIPKVGGTESMPCAPAEDCTSNATTLPLTWKPGTDSTPSPGSGGNHEATTTAYIPPSGGDAGGNTTDSSLSPLGGNMTDVTTSPGNGGSSDTTTNTYTSPPDNGASGNNTSDSSPASLGGNMTDVIQSPDNGSSNDTHVTGLPPAPTSVPSSSHTTTGAMGY